MSEPWAECGHIGRVAIELGLGDRQRTLALARPDEQKAHAGSGLTDQSGRLEQVGMPFCRVRRVTVITTSLPPSPSAWRSSSRDGPESLARSNFSTSIPDPGISRLRPFTEQPVALEERHVVAVLEQSRGRRASREPMQLAVDRAQCEGFQ